MIFRRNGMSPNEVAKMENLEATVERLEAYVEYVAMMADVDIPIEEDSNESEI